MLYRHGMTILFAIFMVASCSSIFVFASERKEDSLGVDFVFTQGFGGIPYNGGFSPNETVYGMLKIGNLLKDQSKIDLTISAVFYTKDGAKIACFPKSPVRLILHIPQGVEDPLANTFALSSGIAIPSSVFIGPGEHVLALTVRDTVSMRSGECRKNILIYSKDDFVASGLSFVTYNETLENNSSENDASISSDFLPILPSKFTPVFPMFSPLKYQPVACRFQVQHYSLNNQNELHVDLFIEQIDISGKLIFELKNKPCHGRIDHYMPLIINYRLRYSVPGKYFLRITLHDRVSGKKASYRMPYMIVDVDKELGHLAAPPEFSN